MRTGLRNFILWICAGVVMCYASLPGFARAHTCDPDRILNPRSSVNSGEYKHWVYSNQFTTWRDLNEIERVLENFKLLMDRLIARGGIHLDGGAAFARPQVQLIEKLRKQIPTGKLPVQFIASSISYPKEYLPDMLTGGFSPDAFAKHQAAIARAKASGDLIYVEGDIIHLAEKLKLQGKVDLISDVLGPSTYSNFSLVLRAYLEMLKPRGVALIYMPSLIIDQPGVVDTSIKFARTRERFFAESSGFQIRYDFHARMLMVTRTEGPIKVPSLVHVATDLEGAIADAKVEYEWIVTRSDMELSRLNPKSPYFRGTHSSVANSRARPR